MRRDARRLLGLGRLMAKPLVAIESKYAADEIAGFFLVQGALESAQVKLDALDVQLAAATTERADAKAAQHDSLETLALELSNDGFPRVHPFTAFSAFSMSDLLEMRPVQGQTQVASLVAKVEASEATSPGSKKAARALIKTTEAFVEADNSCRGLDVEIEKSIELREAQVPAWRAAEQKLRTAIAFADQHEGTVNYDKVFRKRASGSKKKVKAPVVEVPALAPSAPTN